MIKISAPAKISGKTVIAAEINKTMDIYPESNFKDALETMKTVIEQYTTINEKNSRLGGDERTGAAP